MVAGKGRGGATTGGFGGGPGGFGGATGGFGGAPTRFVGGGSGGLTPRPFAAMSSRHSEY